MLDESHFNPTPGVEPSFSFNSATGDDVYLVSANPAGKLLNFIDHVDFPAAANGESFGRWPNATGKLYPMVSRTLGAANSGPRIGPVVISEIMYNHPSFNDDLEYVELLNITDNPINLTNWKFDRGIDMTFGNVTIQPRSTLVVVRFDPNDPLNATKVNDFRTAYAIGAAIPLAGGYAGLLNGGVLDNGGETIRLARPNAPEPDLTIPYLLVDEVEYDDVAPWPTTPDGTGPSLTRVNTQTVYGHEPTNWTGAIATPGTLPLPAAATNLTANATAANRVHLAWLDPATNETGFKVERSTDGANFIVVATLGANATSYDDVNLQSSLGYFYRVRSFNDAGNGGASNTAQVTTPQLVTITGLAGHDTYHVKRVGEQIHVYENTPAVGQPTYSSELAALGASLSINALAGDDTLNVSANGQPNLGVNQLVFNSGSGSNALQLTEGAARIDSTVDVGSVLSSTVSAGAQLTTAQAEPERPHIKRRQHEGHDSA